jgi:hypothetical protein
MPKTRRTGSRTRGYSSLNARNRSNKTGRTSNYRNNETHWLHLVKSVFNARTNCPYRQKLRMVLRAASKLYCKNSRANMRELRAKTKSQSGYRDTETYWLTLVKDVLRNSECRWHRDLKRVLSECAKVYCKNKTSKSNGKSRSRTVKRKKSRSILQTLGLAA